jgi:hypothetical protein
LKESFNRKFVPYVEKDFSIYDNKYVIYWYQYDYLNSAWKLMEAATNIGLSSSDDSNKGFLKMYPDEENAYLKQILDAENTK